MLLVSLGVAVLLVYFLILLWRSNDRLLLLQAIGIVIAIMVAVAIPVSLIAFGLAQMAVLK